MSHRTWRFAVASWIIWSRWFATGLVASALVVGAPPQVGAQQEANAEAPGNTGRLTLNMGVDWVSEYFFRGIAQQVGRRELPALRLGGLQAHRQRRAPHRPDRYPRPLEQLARGGRQPRRAGGSRVLVRSGPLLHARRHPGRDA